MKCTCGEGARSANSPFLSFKKKSIFVLLRLHYSCQSSLKHNVYTPLPGPLTVTTARVPVLVYLESLSHSVPTAAQVIQRSFISFCTKYDPSIRSLFFTTILFTINPYLAGFYNLNQYGCELCQCDRAGSASKSCHQVQTKR